MNLDFYVWSILQKVLEPTAKLFEVSMFWVILFYICVTILAYYKLKEGRK